MKPEGTFRSPAGAPPTAMPSPMNSRIVVSTATSEETPTLATASGGGAPAFCRTRTFVPTEPTAEGASNVTNVAANCVATSRTNGTGTGVKATMFNAAPT